MTCSRRWGTALIAIVFLSSTLMFLLLSEQSAAEDVEVQLYLHDNMSMDTEPSRSNEVGEAMRNGDELEYVLSYPLVRDMIITGRPDGSARVLTLHIQDLTIIAGEWSLGVEIFMDPATGASLKVAGTEAGVEDIENDDIELPLTSPTMTLKKGSTIRTRISFQGTPQQLIPPSLAFAYAGTLTGGYTTLSIVGEPIADSDVTLRLLDPNGQPVKEVIPYGPEEARTIDLIAQASSVFGAYDIDTMNILMISSQGGILLNVTGEPEEQGGEENATFEHVYILPEGTPSDTYNIFITAESNTGCSVTRETSLEVRPGLFLTMENPDREADAGDAVTFQLEVLNGGDANDRVEFSAGSLEGWSIDVPDTIEIDGGSSSSVEFRVYVPLRAQLSEEDVITFEAISRNAERTYTATGKITVTGVATYGIEPIGDTVRPLFAGSVGTFQVRVINILNSTKTFEMASEGLPTTWSVSYSSTDGELQGSLYVFEVNASGEEVVDVMVTTSSTGPFGTHPFGSYVRARGETEKKWIYFTLKVVDGSRDVVEAGSGDQKQVSGRVGTNYPIKYSKVYFSLDLYNPTLEDLQIGITVDGPEGWYLGSDYEDIELSPGASSLWNLSVTPATGALWNLGNPYRMDVGIDAGAEGQFSKNLEVIIPEVSDIKAEREWSSVSTVEEQTVPLNLTFSNKGNRDETISISLEAPPELTVNLTPGERVLEPGGSFTARGEIKVNDVEEPGAVSLKVRYSSSKGTYSLDYSIYIEKKDDGTPFNYLTLIIIAVVVIVLAIVGYIVYNRFFHGKEKKKGDEGAVGGQKQPADREPSASTGTDAPASGVAVPTEDPEIIRKADDALASILGDDAPGGGGEPERVEVVEATVVE
ncbi:MAG: hypothetical protein JXA22_10770 [Candidatus Thermoplasmatota archaeon]|nr:hypothetical protein [Candidatus Thermoplasmatota archaeon]